ncbi:MAG TPA: hypothetical protein VMH78_03775 [Thermoplasmata archaeon]|nr:hypothetical protein [Thermoplasmata archaeon]
MTGRRRPSELEGFLVGVEHRWAERLRVGRGDPRIARAVADARAAWAGARWAEAEARLTEADRLLDETAPEMALQPTRAGPVAHVPIGDPGVPPPEEEEPTANRILLVQRLLAVASAQGVRVDDLVPRMGDAWTAYRANDRTTARRIADAVHAALDDRYRPGAAPGAEP